MNQHHVPRKEKDVTQEELNAYLESLSDAQLMDLEDCPSETWDEIREFIKKNRNQSSSQ